MTRTECGHGHIYDSDIHATCPYCNGPQSRIDFTNGAVGHSAGAGMGGGYGVPVSQGGATAPPAGYQPAGVGGGSIPGGTPIAQGGATMPPSGYTPPAKERTVEDSGATVAEIVQSIGFDPVVGWLVCIEGDSKGKDFRLLSRRNRIGRGKRMDICIAGDRTISEDNHAFVSYDSRANTFWLAQGDSTNNIYYNDALLHQPVQLSPYDLIDFGSTKLIFVPLCTPHFSWKQGDKG